MKLLCLLLFLATVALRGLATEPPLPLTAAMTSGQVSLTASGNGRDQLTLALRNASPSALTIGIPAGLIASSRDAASRVVVLRAASVNLAAHGESDVVLPVAALTLRSVAKVQSFELSAATEPRLDALLKALADQPDAPRSTAQLAVFGLLEDVTFAQWRQFLSTASEPQPTPAEVTQAIDALGLLRSVAPERTFALAGDAELKVRALRNPWCRAKAMAIYGLDLGDGAAPPDLRQLLHTQPGDNCPICRQRTLMQKQAEIP